MATQVVDRSAFKHGSLGKQVAFSVVTFGLYTLYWMYSTAEQLNAGTDAEINPIMAVVPVLGQWILSDAAEAVTDYDQMVLFLMFFVGPVGWFFVQTGINDIAAGA